MENNTHLYSNPLLRVLKPVSTAKNSPEKQGGRRWGVKMTRMKRKKWESGSGWENNSRIEKKGRTLPSSAAVHRPVHRKPKGKMKETRAAKGKEEKKKILGPVAVDAAVWPSESSPGRRARREKKKKTNEEEEENWRWWWRLGGGQKREYIYIYLYIF